jgi:hypothetical protein
MKTVLAIGVSSILFFTILVSSCKNSIDNPIGDIVFPSSGVSYSRQVQPLFNVGCIYSGCHDDETKSGGLSLTNFIDATTDVPGVVYFNGDTNCVLIERVYGNSSISIMPPAPASPLNLNQRHGLATWVREGAKNN